jgi:rod shape-determining protein MreD
MPYFYYLVTWLFVIFIQMVVSPRITIGGIYPDVVIAAAVLMGLRKGWKRGLWFGFAFGITADLVDPQNYGWTTLLVSFSGYLAGIVREKIFLDNTLYQAAAAFSFTLISQLLYQIINWPEYSLRNFGPLLSNSLLISLYTFIVSLLALIILNQRSKLKELL